MNMKQKLINKMNMKQKLINKMKKSPVKAFEEMFKMGFLDGQYKPAQIFKKGKNCAFNSMASNVNTTIEWLNKDKMVLHTGIMGYCDIRIEATITNATTFFPG